jgi:glycerol-3-phosphate dehydrogenase
METPMARRKSAASEGEIDLAVIGGGITGAGIARDAALRGLRVLVVEQSDIAGGTSSCSSKLVHGGLRYLEHGELSLVFESVAERRTLLEIAPHLVQPLPFLLPVFEDSRRGMFTINIGMWLYDGLSLFRSPKLHKSLTRRRVCAVEPHLRTEGLQGAQVYYDCSTDDARLTLETMLDAVRASAEVRTHTRVEGFVMDGERIAGLQLVDQLDGTHHEVRAKVVVNATGPWSDQTRSIAGPVSHERMRPTKGIHIVVNSSRLKLDHAICCMHPNDGRVFFTIPWGEQTYIGTTDTDIEGDPGDVVADASDVAYLLAATNDYFPDLNITAEDVISTWAGVRPLVGDEEAEDESSVSREHVLAIEPSGMVTIAGGKLTTYRRMAAEVVDAVVEELDKLGKDTNGLRPAETALNPLPGAIGWPEDADLADVAQRIEAASDGLIGDATAALLARTYGMRGIDIARGVVEDPSGAELLVEGRPEIAAQIDWGVRRELARTASDLMMRRTQLYYRDADQGLGVVEAVAARVAELLGLSEAEQDKQVVDYREQVQRSRCWRDE